jgi:hypothetical protein
MIPPCSNDGGDPGIPVMGMTSNAVAHEINGHELVPVLLENLLSGHFEHVAPMSAGRNGYEPAMPQTVHDAEK